MKRKRYVIFLCVLSVASCAHVDTTAFRQCVDVGAVRGHPQMYAGQVTNVCGVLADTFEDHNLYGSAKAAAQHSQTECLSVGTAAGFRGDLRAFAGRRVQLSGTVTAKFCPPGVLCTGSCSPIGIFVESVSEQD
ncbi:MAG TPA: hypothetical protein VFG73_11510 [Rhodanobacteraceae bacterium]|nr:hypothetical protein [Rhodanobacteraceae bacterium]